ncbi:MFS transporter [Streptomyces beijiangensis]|uniref:MFS transporter n=1 Tax=Streptomyces beijiangensis TaxID=163361 RepID=A0A939JJH0_9ACTN|nr:MFS transporter [Streptomyces beijiangensis]MBO0514742.1 MFS transporter [Streptomyces beijiangensis]
MRSYQDLFRTREFTPLFATVSLYVAASTVSGIALGVLVYEATGSPLLSALSMFGGSFAQVIGAVALLSAADRLEPRAALVGLALVFGIGTAVLAVPGLPLWGSFVVILLLGLIGSVGGGVRYGLLGEVLPKEGFILGRSVFNMSSGIMQICGFGLGGLLIAAVSARATLVIAAGLAVAAAVVARYGLSRRPARATGRPSVRETWRVNTLLFSSGPRRAVLLALWVPNGLIVGCEALFVPYSPEHAALLLAVAAFGMFTGDVLVGRVLPVVWRVRLATPLRLLLAVPYLLFALRPGLPVVLVAVAVASVGYSASLVLMERLVELTPDDVQGQALGLHTSGMLTMQGVGAVLAGAVAQHMSAANAMAVMAGGSVLVSVVQTPGLRSAQRSMCGRNSVLPGS